MPLISTFGAASSRGLGEFTSGNKVPVTEDVFSALVYENQGGANTTIDAGVPLSDTAAWTANVLSGGSNSVRARKLVRDSSGNIYLALNANDNVSLDYSVIVKYNSSFTVQWQRTVTSDPNDVYVFSLAVDSSGNVYVCGYQYDSTYYGILIKYNSSGTLQWQRRFSRGQSYAWGVITDSLGNIYVCGETGNSEKGIILKYNSSGTLQWQIEAADTGQTVFLDIGIDSSNNVYVTGNGNDGTRYTCLLKYNSSGTLQWQRKYTDSTGQGEYLKVDSSGNSYVVSRTSNGTLYRLVLLKYNSSGTLQWKKKYYEGANSSNTGGIDVDSSGNIYIGGQTGNYRFITKLDSTPSIQWERSFSLPYDQNVYPYSLSAAGSDLFVLLEAEPDYTRYQSCVLSLKTDGTTLSGKAFICMSSFSGTLADAGGTDSAGTISDSAGGATDAAGNVTDTAGSLTASSSTQNTVSGTGGLMWFKARNNASIKHLMFDTTRGATKYLQSNSSSSETTDATTLKQFTAFGSIISNGIDINDSSYQYSAWTFRKYPRFFDVVSFTGDGTNGRSLIHKLGVSPGMILVKAVGAAGDWLVYHRSMPTSGGSIQGMVLNSTSGASTGSAISATAPTAKTFYVDSTNGANTSSTTYVAYLFAHDESPQGVIKCGSYTAASGSVTDVDVGFEPQFLVAVDSSGSNWYMWDKNRGFAATDSTTSVANAASALYANSNSGEVETNICAVTSRGFKATSSGSSSTWVYLAVKRGPSRIPSSAQDVFSIAYRTSNDFDYMHVVCDPPLTKPDLVISRPNQITGSSTIGSLFCPSLTAGYSKNYFLGSASDSSEITDADTFMNSSTYSLAPSKGTTFSLAYQLASYTVGNDATYALNYGTTNKVIGWCLRRAPGFYDTVSYVGSGTNPTTIYHSLGVAPEMIIIKARNDSSDWIVQSTYLTSGSVGSSGKYLYLNSDGAEARALGTLFSSAPTTTAFTVTSEASVNSSSRTYIAHLFATCPGVSKVSTYTGTGSSLTVNCGFTGGARFVWIKRVDSTGAWYVWDTTRGMVSGTDPSLKLNTTDAEVNANSVYTTTGGFQVVSTDAALNASGGTYFYLAIA